ncbi:MAG: hypothetical protein ABIP21_11260 [Acidimicrobiia bacterium]
MTDVEGKARVLPRGPAGNYDVDLFVNPPRGGDLSVRFRWTTPKPGPANRPRAQASVLAHSTGSIDSVGVELLVSDLAATPTRAIAAITVTAANGAASRLDLSRIESPCADDGSLFFAGSKEAGNAAAQLGPQPFTYTVSLTIDGVPYEANARWPDDVDVDCAPCVPLRFTPPLPAVVVERSVDASKPADAANPRAKRAGRVRTGG